MTHEQEALSCRTIFYFHLLLTWFRFRIRLLSHEHEKNDVVRLNVCCPKSRECIVQHICGIFAILPWICSRISNFWQRVLSPPGHLACCLQGEYLQGSYCCFPGNGGRVHGVLLPGELRRRQGRRLRPHDVQSLQPGPQQGEEGPCILLTLHPATPAAPAPCFTAGAANSAS